MSKLSFGIKLSLGGQTKSAKPLSSRPAAAASAASIFGAADDDNVVGPDSKRPRLAGALTSESQPSTAMSDEPGSADVMLPAKPGKLSNIEALITSGTLGSTSSAALDTTTVAAPAVAPGAAASSPDSVDAFLSTLVSALPDKERADITAASHIAMLSAADLARAQVTDTGAIVIAAPAPAPVPAPVAGTGSAESATAAGSVSAVAGAAASPSGPAAGAADTVSSSPARIFGDEDELDEADYASPGSAGWAQRQATAAAALKAKKEVAAHDSTAALVPFTKCLYREHPDVAALTAEEVAVARKRSGDTIKLRGLRIPKPVSRWVHCGLPSKIDAVLAKEGFAAPFPIQAQTMPAIMSGRDVIACAKTGSGKTLAFTLPMLRHVLAQPDLEPGDGPIAVVLAPVRELAVQITAEIRKFAKPVGLRAIAAYGGANISEQIAKLKAGAHIIVATPGRLIDLLTVNSGRTTNLRRVTFLVLDEADRMFDLGFESQIMRVVAGTRPDRQTLLFSATFPKVVEQAARKILTQPIEAVIGGRSTASSDIEQIIHVIPEDRKFLKLLELLGAWYSRGNIIIFVDRQDAVDQLFKLLAEAGYPALAVHGGMDQVDRDYMISDFKNKIRTVMVATSILARGLDVKELVLVVNFDVPSHYEDYVHRIGRTARAGAKGTAVTLVTPEQDAYTPDLVRGLKQAGQEVPAELQALHEGFLDKVARKEARLRANRGYHTTGYKYDEAEATALADSQLLQRAARAESEGAALSDLMVEMLERRKHDDEVKRKERLEKLDSSGAIAVPAGAAGAAAAAAGGSGTAASAGSAKGAEMGASAAPLTGLAAALAAAARLERELGTGSGGGLGGGGGGSSGVGASGERFHVEFEVNDYPEKARWNVLRKQGLSDVIEDLEVAITTKGVFVEAGKRVPDGERKLYLLIEGKSEEAVRRARTEIFTRLEQVAATVRPELAAVGSKYSI